MADDTSMESLPRADVPTLGQGLLKILKGVGYGLSGMVGEVRAGRDRQEAMLTKIGMLHPELLDVPEISKAFQKGLGLSQEGFEAYKAHAHVTGFADTLAQTLGIPTTEMKPQQLPPGGQRMLPSASTSTPTGAQAVAPVPTERVARPQADILGDVVKALPVGGSISSGGGRTGQPKLTVTRKEAASGATGFSKLLEERDAAVRSGDYKRAAELQTRIGALSYTPGERTLETEKARLDPDLVASKLDVEEAKQLRKIAPASTLKDLQTPEGKDVPAGSLTNEQVLAMTKAGTLIKRKTFADKILRGLGDKLFGNANPFGAGAAAPAEAAPVAIERPAAAPSIDDILKKHGY